MKYVLLLLIRLYWIVPRGMRRPCLFRNSCSRFVYRVARAKGFAAGVTALQRRRRRCRGGYCIHDTPDGRRWVILADRSVVPIGVTKIEEV
ncbi:MAG TPA: membrane protein insertion efficiency factor YidD [Chitinophagaceae bacterium]|nr:membrane protein insertion efficiency factor YidD [Chitinophagaceae bacterium]HMU57277.1 membrane protein insertion efficiency factor YidD [Chitinophagaceae bacterium]